MKRTRRVTVSEPLYGTSIEVYANHSQTVALRRCAKLMGLDANDPANKPDESAAGWCMSHEGTAVIWLEDYPADQASSRTNSGTPSTASCATSNPATKRPARIS